MNSIFDVIKEDNIIERTNIKENSNNVDGTICVENLKIIVTDPIGKGKPALISPNPKLSIYIDGDEIKRITPVYSKNNITYSIKTEEAKREITIKCVRNEMQALMSIKYDPKIEYVLSDTKKSNELGIELVQYKITNPPLYTVEEIKKRISHAGIIYGVKFEMLQYMSSGYEVDGCIFAEGKEPILYIEDKVELKFKKGPPKYKEDLKGTIDYKAIGHVFSVEVGQVLGEIIPGKDGCDGINVKGKITKVKRPRKLKVAAGSGTEQKGNEIISVIKGKPLYSGGKISVAELHEIRGNVDLSTGNIRFSGQVVIFGSVLEGMLVEGTKGVEIYKSVANSNILSSGDVYIDGNGLMSEITAGGMENTNSELRGKMNDISVKLKQLYDDCKILINKNVLGYEVRCGEVVKILIEKKYKDLTFMINDFFDLYMSCDECDKKLIINLKYRILGGGPLTIDNLNVILDLIESLNTQSESLKTQDFLEADIKLSYCQDCVLRATGNIYINGRGDYQSNIKANEGVYFSGIKSITRGGKIEAGKIIKCNFVGSDAGVKTELKVSKEGEIFANFAYHNTKFVVGNYEYTLQEPCKNVHVYLGHDYDLKVDKLKA